jgi:uncharacterized protein (TIGR03084 family)
MTLSNLCEVTALGPSALEEQLDELAGILAQLGESDWRRPTPCEGWDVADVVLHLAQTNEMAIASLEDRYPEVVDQLTAGLPAASDVDEGAAAMVARDREEFSAAAVHDRWTRGAATLARLARSGDPRRRVLWVAGQLSARTLVTTRLAETWIHTGDIASAIGVRLVPAERLQEVARLAWRTLPYAFARSGRKLAGPVAFHLQGPTGASWDFIPEGDAMTVIRGSGCELSQVAARRIDPGGTSLLGEGPDASAVLALVRTYA